MLQRVQVDQCHRLIVVEEHVGELQVAMNDTGRQLGNRGEGVVEDGLGERAQRVETPMIAVRFERVAQAS